MKIARVFPRRTTATPNDALAFFEEPGLFPPQVEEVHVSVLFTYDLPRAEMLAESWNRVAPVKIGGPALGMRGEEFSAGKYIRPGYTITSRGCPNKCWFCSVWKRDGEIRELEIIPGYNVLDDNLLACSESHIRNVFEMLRAQPEPADFSGGWEAARLKSWHIDLLLSIRLHQVWFAYDTKDDFEPLVEAGRLLRSAGLSYTKTGNVSHKVRCYCLVGYPGDTFPAAEKRMKESYASGFFPMAMLYRDEKGKTDYEWRRFQKWWARPASINRMCRDNSSARN